MKTKSVMPFGANQELKKARIIGTVTVLSYIVNYFLRNMLGVLTPFMIKTSTYTTSYLAMLSSCYMVAYAVGQLFNGFLGDLIKPKRMILIGLVSAGIASMLFPFMPYQILQILCFLIQGYGLSMVRGPLMKIISENTQTKYARIICVFFSFASFAGPFIASLISIFFHWEYAFAFAGSMAILIAVSASFCFAFMEKKQIIQFHPMNSTGLKGILQIFRDKRIIFFIVIACLAEITATSISFWIPTLLAQYTHFSEKESGIIFSFMALLRAIVPFLTLFVYKLLNERDLLLIKIAFGLQFAFFVALLLTPAGIFSVVTLLGALMVNGLLGALLWSIYIPELGKTGRVSSVNGVLDCSGYMAAAVATGIFAQTVNAFSWRGLMAAWIFLPIAGIFASTLYEKSTQPASGRHRMSRHGTS